MNALEHLIPKKMVALSFFGLDLSIANSSITGFMAVAAVAALFFFARRSPILRTVSELAIDFVYTEMLAPLGKEKERWLPFIMSVFCYVLFCSLLGLIPGLLSPTSNINATGSLAVVVFLTVQSVGISRKGFLGYFKSFIPEGVPVFIVPFLFPIELVGRLAQPFSLALRLFANMFAGHAVMLSLVGLIFVFKSAVVASLSVAGDALVSAFEVFVCFIQAFVFAYLTSTYLTAELTEEH
ncbi:ATP synthase F0 subunit A [candidate division WOR-1 bacterium RIFOXYA12_FULL_43_27]|uniref:ATP synthase subunit a n=1 Tax=candidate division WOR-1 bacterium RIFOXYC2_FULL_46_14 TaxID=1802587 RepID=A0A1F4U7C9_UNCSA|nr:MAG: ATP synthase F0 subunit A [candidate division WOR-1 bacterium RIFOXYA12_FULL_43_27]OGC19212.1 MAG: ATP synthase F0 subunit A [candidate division WOR-1 bacterium RIFOXYB2_FULL_46_45]OGC30201.1 MAG: ATP synthase F0 subunit A [candidate division WOR-1 bacterium RIFOXYA2_FULL_46_56]OGC40802.1 MAG: ATP synthase F0 subunit A [candidate division WOR-1 bacterium RIFOXYC2_FULL_46_14]